MKRQKIIRLINEMWGDLADANDKLCLITDDLVDIFRLGVKHGEKEKETYKCLIHSTDWLGKCFICNEQVFTREPETNKSGEHKDNPEWCKGESKCSLKSKFGNHGCKLPYIKCKYDTRNYE